MTYIIAALAFTFAASMIFGLCAMVYAWFLDQKAKAEREKMIIDWLMDQAQFHQ